MRWKELHWHLEHNARCSNCETLCGVRQRHTLHCRRHFRTTKGLFVKNLKCARRSAAAGPSGTTTWDCCSKSLSGSPPPFQNPTEVAWGMWQGDVFRRLVAMTMTQQLAGDRTRHQSVSICAVDESRHRVHGSRHPSIDGPQSRRQRVVDRWDRGL